MGPGPPTEEDGAWTMTEADDQAPAAEGNNPSMPHNVPFRHVPSTWGDIKALNAGAKV